MHSSRMRTAHGSSHPQGGEGLPQCMLGYTPPPRCGPGDPPTRCWPGEPPPWLDPSISPLGVGLETPPPLETCKAYSDAGIPPAMHAGIPPPPYSWTEFLTHATENITLPQTSFAGNKNFVVSSMVGQMRATHSLHLYFRQH